MFVFQIRVNIILELYIWFSLVSIQGKRKTQQSVKRKIKCKRKKEGTNGVEAAPAAAASAADDDDGDDLSY